MERYVCIHGHFYQPPRENPWLEAIEVQDPAYPFHDWNERITAECYAPNSASRLLDDQGRITGIVNTYGRISFDFGPTLLSWLEANAPEVYQAILEADRESQGRFSGHGSAMAQAYNHIILPLASSRDRETQVAWGIADFQHRFGRPPEGMWLPETAVDLESLEALAAHGIRFTVLAPHQARRVRPLGSPQWQDVSGARVDPTMPYAVPLPSGRSIAVFFYDGPISRAVAFEDLLSNGGRLAERLIGSLPQRPRAQLVHIATDGETYGHHHRFGDMALAYALHQVEGRSDARLTNYGEFLALHPPTHEAQVFEGTSWSCAHGVERWRADCGCNSGAHPGWRQAWRAPLREALDWLRDLVAPHFSQAAAPLLQDPWAARDDYIQVALDRSPEVVDGFLGRHSTHPLSREERVRALKLLEMERHAMLMYTSCGWFFDDLSGIETVQVLQYADRTVQLAQELFGDAIEEGFLRRLERAGSNVPAVGNGRQLYEAMVRPAMVDWERVGAHYAISSLFQDYGERSQVYSYLAERQDYTRMESGRVKLALGRCLFTSRATEESAELSFGVLHFGDHNINGGVRQYQGPEAYASMVAEIQEAFGDADFPRIIRLMDRHFGESNYSLKSLFRDEQRKVLGLILESALSSAEAAYRQLYERQAPLMRFLTALQLPVPRAFQVAAELFLGTDLRRSVTLETLDLERARGLLQEAKALSVDLDTEGLAYQVAQTVAGLFRVAAEDPASAEGLELMATALDLAASAPITPNLWTAQNLYYQMARRELPGRRESAKGGREEDRRWVALFTSLGDKLSVRP